MKRRVLLSILLMLAGCTNRGVYEGIQASARHDCSTLPPSQYEECMEAANVSFDEYQRQREELENP